MNYICIMILLGIVIFAHELGHFWAALAVGVKVDTLSVGFGPRLFGIKRRGIDFRVSAVPLGGYVRIVDQFGNERTIGATRFQSATQWERAVVIIAGPLMNVALALGIVAGLYTYAFPKQSEITAPTITFINAGSPAAQAGLQLGDRIIQIESKRNPSWHFVLMQEALNANHPINGLVERRDQHIRFSITPAMDPKRGIGIAGWSSEQNLRIGELRQDSPAARAGLRTGDLLLTANGCRLDSFSSIQQAVLHSRGHVMTLQVMRNRRVQSITVSPAATNDRKIPWQIGVRFKMPVQMVSLRLRRAMEESVRLNQESALMTFQFLAGILKRRVSPKALSGPIGIASAMREAATTDSWSYLFLMASVSLEIAIFNLLPIPGLDGGVLLMLIIETLLRRKLSPQVNQMIFALGRVFLITIIVLVIYNDLSNILSRSGVVSLRGG